MRRTVVKRRTDHDRHRRSLSEIERRLRSYRQTGSLRFRSVGLGSQMRFSWPFGFVRVADVWLEFGVLWWVVYRVPRSAVVRVARPPLLPTTDTTLRFDLKGSALPGDITFAGVNYKRLRKELLVRGWDIRIG